MTAFATDTVCDALAALESRAQANGYLVTVWPHHEPHQSPVEIDHYAACLHLFEPETADHDADLAALVLMASAVTDIEARTRTVWGADHARIFVHRDL
jgi:hypothetical protein